MSIGIPPHSFRVAAVQATPVFLNREATTAKACNLIRDAAAQGARLVVFPEAFIPTYPFWVWFIPPGQTRPLRDLYMQMLSNAVRIPDATTIELCSTARECGINVVMGINEVNTEASQTTMYNS